MGAQTPVLAVLPLLVITVPRRVVAPPHQERPGVEPSISLVVKAERHRPSQAAQRLVALLVVAQVVEVTLSTILQLQLDFSVVRGGTIRQWRLGTETAVAVSAGLLLVHLPVLREVTLRRTSRVSSQVRFMP